MRTQDIEYRADGVRMVGQYVVDDGRARAAAGVLVCHEGPGLTEHTKKIAARLAGHGLRRLRHGLSRRRQAASQHGRGQAADRRLVANPTGIMARATAALEVLEAQKEVDTAPLAAIGYCFGGTTALELGRRGAATSRRSSASIPGSAPRVRRRAKNIKAKVLVSIGAEDPIIPPEQRTAFEAEMKAAGIDWRLLLYGGAGHSFTNPGGRFPRHEGLLLPRGHRPPVVERHDRTVQ